MAKPRLKVYRKQMGFAETIVAASSQKAALDVWGARQNLFGEGLASVTDDPAAVEAAVSRPGVVLQRPVGAGSAFTQELMGRPEPPSSNPAARAAKPKPKPKPDRAALTAAEAALSAFEREAATAVADLERRRKPFDEEAARLARDLDAARSAARRKVEAARRAFEAA